jgi:hypothetical protein
VDLESTKLEENLFAALSDMFESSSVEKRIEISLDDKLVGVRGERVPGVDRVDGGQADHGRDMKTIAMPKPYTKPLCIVFSILLTSQLISACNERPGFRIKTSSE